MPARVTAYDIAQAGSMKQLIGQTIEQLRYGNSETKDFASQVLRSVTEMKGFVDDAAGKKPDGSKLDSANGDKPKLSLDNSKDGIVGLLDNTGLIVQQGGVKPLIQALKDGSSNAQRDSAGALANIANGQLANQEKIVDAGGIVPLATILKTGDAGAQEQAAAALASISQNLKLQETIIKAGAINPLVALLKGNQRHDAQINAAQALANLATEYKEGQIAIAKAGAIPLLLALLGSGKAQEATSHALGRLAFENLDNQREICKLGGIAKLLPPLSGVNTDAQVQAAAAVAALAGGERNRRRQDAIAKAGGIRPLLALVESRYNAAKCMGLHALAQVAMNNRSNQDAIAALDGLPPLVLLISAGITPTEVQKYAARALAELVKHNHANQTTVADLGAISLLVSLMRSSNNSTVEAEVAGALGSLSEGHVQNQGAVASAGAVNALVGLLGSRSDHAANQSANALSAIGLDNAESQREIAKLLVGLLTTAKRESTQERAASALWRLVRQNPSDQLHIAKAGGAQQLVKLLRDGPAGGRSFALWSLSLCIDETNQNVVVESGAIAPLVKCLVAGDIVVTEQAAGAINKLATINTVSTIADAGAISPLISLLDGEDNLVRQHAAGAVSAVALVPAQRIAIDRAGGIAPLVSLLIDPIATEATKKFSAAALALLSDEADDVAAALAAEAAEEERRKQAEYEAQWERQQAAEEATLNKRHGLSLEGGGSPQKEFEAAVDDDDAPEPASPPMDSEGMTSTNAESTSEQAAVRIEIPGQPVQSRLKAKRKSIAPSHAGDGKQEPLHKAINRSPRKTAIAEEGAIAPLVALLGKDGEAAQEEAAGALRALAEESQIREAITEAGGIGPLVALLGGSNPLARENAEGALVRLSTEMANRVLIIEQLVAMLYKEDIAAREQAAAAIANLAHESTANCTSIVDAGGIPPLLALLESESAKAKENSASAITQLARGSRPNQDAITKAGGIPLLVSVLTASSKGDTSQNQMDAIITHAMHAIWMMAKKNFPNQVALAEAGVITPLVGMLGNASPELQLPATGVIECLLQSKDIQAAVVRTGAIAPLCMLSRDGLLDTQEQAAAALWSLATDGTSSEVGLRNNAMANKTTIAKLGGIESLVKMFYVGGSEKSQKNAAGALSSIASKHNENRLVVARRIVSQLNGKITPEIAARTLAAITRMCGRKVVTEKSWGSIVDILTADQAANQSAIAKLGGVPAIITWLGNPSEEVQKEAAHALLAMATNNPQTQNLIAKVEGLEGLIAVVNHGCLEAQEHAALALWHLASSEESQQAIADADGIQALVNMLGLGADGGSGARAAELAAVTIVRLAQGNPGVSETVADAGGVLPLVKLLKLGSGAAQQAAAALAELALLTKNRDSIANAGGIEPLIKLLSDKTTGTPEVAARALAHVARADEEDEQMTGDSVSKDKTESSTGAALQSNKIVGADERRAHIKHLGGVKRLIQMLDGSNLSDGRRATLSGSQLWGLAATKMDETAEVNRRNAVPSSMEIGIKMGMQEQAAAALAEFANGDSDLQDAIIEEGGVPKLLQLVHEGRGGVIVAQEHAARTLSFLSTSVENQRILVLEGCIPELVTLVRSGTPKAQEVSAFALSNIARGGGAAETNEQRHTKTKEELGRKKRDSFLGRRHSIDLVDPSMALELARLNAQAQATPRPFNLRIVPTSSANAVIVVRVILELPSEGPGSPSRASSPEISQELVQTLDEGLHASSEDEDDEEEYNGAREIRKENGIPAIVALMSDKKATPLAKENAAAALWHLALDEENRDLIASSNGIAPLVALLSDGTHQAQLHASDALARLANQGRDHQSQIAKKLVGLLMANHSTTVQQRAAHALQMLAVDNPGSPVVIVNAGAISPLVHLLSTTTNEELKKEVADALETLVASSDNNAAAVTDLVVLLGTGSLKAQELVAQLLVTLCSSKGNRDCISQSGAMQKLVAQLTSPSEKIQELCAAALSYLSGDSSENVTAIANFDGVTRMVALLKSSNGEAQSYAAAVLADLTNDSEATLHQVVSAGAIDPLVSILANSTISNAKAEAAGALGRLAKGNLKTQDAVVEAGAIPPLVILLEDRSRRAQRKSAAALAALVSGKAENQAEVLRCGGIKLLVALLEDGTRMEVQAHAAAALSELANENKTIQTAIAAAGGIPMLITMLQDTNIEVGMQAAAAAIRSTSAQNVKNQIAVAAHGGILPLVSRLSTANIDVQGECTMAMASIAPGSSDIVATIATLIVKLLRDTSGADLPERASRAISLLARGAPATQDAIASLGGIQICVSLLEESLKVSADSPGFRRGSTATAANESPAANRLASSNSRRGSASYGIERRSPSPSSSSGAEGKEHASNGLLQLELASAIRSLCWEHSANQVAFAQARCIPMLVSLLSSAPFLPPPSEPSKGRQTRTKSITTPFNLAPGGDVRASPLPGSPPILATRNKSKFESDDQAMLSSFMLDDRAQREAAGALWSLAGDVRNREHICDADGIQPLVELLKIGSPGAQETAAGALRAMAATPKVCAAISDFTPIVPLSAVVDKGSAGGKQQAAGVLVKLAKDDTTNQESIAKELLTILSNNRAEELDIAATLAYDLSQDEGNARAMAEAGVIKPLVKQLEVGNDIAVEAAAKALGNLGHVDDDKRGEITHLLINARHHATDLKRQARCGRALDDMNADTTDGVGDDSKSQEAVGMAILLFRLHTRD